MQYFAHIPHIRPPTTLLYAIFRTHSAHPPSYHTVVCDISHIFRPAALLPLCCMRYFTHIPPSRSPTAPLYAIFHTHSAYPLSYLSVVCDISHTFRPAAHLPPRC